jgi:hypothetical protein
LCLGAAFTGCEPFDRDGLVVATGWPAAERRRLEAEFDRWLERRPEPSARAPIRIDWLVLAPGDDLEGLAVRRRPPDVLLGGPAWSYERMAIAQRLAPLPIDGSPGWAVAGKTVIRPVFISSERGESAGAVGRRTAFDDPRNDPILLAWEQAELAQGDFREGYAHLVRTAGSASVVVERGGPDATAAVVATDREVASIPWTEGVAIVAAGRHREQAASFLTFLSETGRGGPIPTRAEPATAADAEIAAELLGATLVDARDELRAAWDAVERAGSPPIQLRWMTEPPPWPPASIVKILGGQGEQAMAMVETLAGQLAPEPSARAWLISSWLSPPRLIDGAVLGELAHAADGRLFREPRFREWLRAEWTAWARQRYRRVQRIVESGRGQTSLATSSNASSPTSDH